MRRTIFALVAITIFSTSCSLLYSITQDPTYGGIVTPPATQQPIESVITTGGSSLLAAFAPTTRTLIVTEDPGTGLYGYLNEFGVWAIQPQFRYAKHFNKELGVAIVQIQNGRWGAINTHAQCVINFSFNSQYAVDEAISSIAKGRYCGIDLWVMEDPNTGLYGYLNYYGNWHIAPQYSYAKYMNSDGFAIVQVSDKRWGAIDRNGNIVIQPNFTSQYDAEEALNALLRK